MTQNVIFWEQERFAIAIKLRQFLVTHSVLLSFDIFCSLIVEDSFIVIRIQRKLNKKTRTESYLFFVYIKTCVFVWNIASLLEK